LRRRGGFGCLGRRYRPHHSPRIGAFAFLKGNEWFAGLNDVPDTCEQRRNPPGLRRRHFYHRFFRFNGDQGLIGDNVNAGAKVRHWPV
jgi:hypothetical protein